jgi:tetratricopeptide (TPR) repeat protein
MLPRRIEANVLGLALAASFLLCIRVGEAQTDMVSSITSARIAAQLRAIESAVGRRANNDELGKLWEQLASDYLDGIDVPHAEEAYGRALKLLHGSVAARSSYATALNGLGALYLLTEQTAESENCRRKALAIFNEEGDRQNVNRVQGDLAVSLLKEGKYKEAEKEASKAIEGMLGQAEANLNDLNTALLTRGYAKCSQRRCKEGLTDIEQAIDNIRAFAQPNSLMAATSWVALGYIEWKTGDLVGADETMRKALQILSEANDLPNQALVAARIKVLNQYQQFLNQTHRKVEARRMQAEMARLSIAQTPACRNCTVNIEGLRNPPP